MLGVGTPTNPTDTVVYTYPSHEGVWGDLLISYDGVSFTYDQIGNPLSYYNGNNYTFTWLGRQLAGATVGGKTYTYTYNDAGIRASKTVDGVTTTYYYDGNLLISEQTPTYTIIYIYDANGSPVGMQYRLNSYAADTWDVYWFEKNLQGDIVAIYDATGTKLISYIYDAWGNQNVTYHNGGASTGAAKNPFTYRGYYYDRDIGFYYLQSRYYDPVVGRFISPDDPGYLGANGDLAGYNLYAYCSNNPVMYEDPEGKSLTAILAVSLFGAFAGGAMGAFTAATTGGNVVESAILGAINGGITSASSLFFGEALGRVLGTVVATAVSGITTGLVDVGAQIITKGSNNIDASRSLKTGMLSAISAMVPGVGNAARDVVDAIGTAIVWFEASALIAAVDSIFTNIASIFQTSDNSSMQKSQSTLR